MAKTKTNSSSSTRGEWSTSNLRQALKSISENRMSVNNASKVYKIPRRSLRDYIDKGNTERGKSGAHAVLTPEQELELKQRIFRLCDLGFPLTAKAVQRAVFQYCSEYKIEHPFNNDKKIAGRAWLEGYMNRHPDIRTRKAQHLNEARAIKLNKPIVMEYFDVLKSTLLELKLMKEPQSIYNIDEKGIRLCLHKSPKVLSKKGSKRVHYRGKEHGENVTVVAAGNALGKMIPPMILFKGKRKNESFLDHLPEKSCVEMTPKGSNTISTFVKFLDHFAKHKTAGPCLLIMDGAKCHFDLTISEVAAKHNIHLLCLPSNTTHELQPMDKSVFHPLEVAWDDEVTLYWELNKIRSLSKTDFCKIFTNAWRRATTEDNVKHGFEACGIYPFNPSKIPEIAYAHSNFNTYCY